jgi:ubiquinol-cytochrome c reductase cytochrome c1 subunit
MIEAAMQSRFVRRLAVAIAGAVLMGPLWAINAVAAEEGAGGESHAVHWQDWHANNEVTNTASLQRGAANFTNYCMGCHSLKYMRYSRMARDLKISDEQLRTNLIAGDAKPGDYMLSSFPLAEGDAWFGRAPPDLSLISRLKGNDYVYRFLKGFYVDASRPMGTNNLALEGAAMPAVLSDLEGVKRAVFAHEAGVSHDGKQVEKFEQVSPGQLNAEQYDAFVRDTVNFLDYVGEPSQVDRRQIGIWAVLFLLVFTAFAWMLKKEYWKDVD